MCDFFTKLCDKGWLHETESFSFTLDCDVQAPSSTITGIRLKNLTSPATGILAIADLDTLTEIATVLCYFCSEQTGYQACVGGIDSSSSNVPTYSNVSMSVKNAQKVAHQGKDSWYMVGNYSGAFRKKRNISRLGVELNTKWQINLFYLKTK